VVLRSLESGEVDTDTVPDFRALLERCAGAAALGIDMPIGLMETVEKGGRPVDRLVRERLKPYRSSSVFSPPCRPALAAGTYAEAAALTRARCEAQSSLTQQAFGLFSKLREVDGLMTPELQRWVKEVHPELCFALLNDDRPLQISKKEPRGQELRVELLRTAGFNLTSKSVKRLAKAGVGRVDVLDAYAVCWTAGRIARGQAEHLGGGLDVDAHGLRMELWV
jgi:predicted RNase H-like nuclease